MAKRLTTEDQLALMRELRPREKSAEGVARLNELLRTAHLHGLALKGAADLAVQWHATELTDALRLATEHLAPDAQGIGSEAVKRDPGCEGKEAALRALVDWDAELPDFYLRASHWTQFAKTITGNKDTAGECRGIAAVGIAFTHAGGEKGLTRLIDLLVDSEISTRARAAQALSMWRGMGAEGTAVLRLKALVGDESADVLGEVLAGILRAQPREEAAEALAFVAGFLLREEHIAEAAALALGQSRDVRALAPLTQAWEHHGRHAIRTSLLMAIALLRQEESIQWLLDQLSKARSTTAVEILDALALYRGDEKIVSRIRAIAEKSREGSAAFREIFG